MEISATTRAQIAAEAVEWFLFLQNWKPHTKDYQAFSEWLTRSPVHIEEFLAVSESWMRLSVVEGEDFSIDSLIAAARQPETTREPANVHRLKAQIDEPLRSEASSRRRIIYWGSFAASLVLCAGIWIGFDRWRHSPDIRTAIGEQRSVTLADGSVVILNTDSEVRVRWTKSERRIELLKGEGQFHVAKNPDRPFLVSTTDATVRAVGTIFNVRNAQAGTQVAVLEGRVNVSAATATAAAAPQSLEANRARGRATGAVKPSLSSVDLDAGGRASISVHGIEQEVGPSVEAVTAWAQRRLIFRGQRLADVVTEFNRYRVQPLVIEDAELQSLRISGVFDLSDQESLLIYLKSFETVNVEKLGDGSLRLRRDAPKLDLRK